jgi:Cu(I)/Ag(I) efflux system membrane fusion protein
MNARLPDLTLVALALAAALAAGCRTAPEEAALDAATGGHDHDGPASEAAAGDGAAAEDAIAHYTCSMHPSVRGAEPGSCPICSMALMPVFRREIASGEIVLDGGRRQRIGVTTARAERRPLAVSVRAVGQVTYDQTRLTEVTLKVGGWIGELFADRLGQRVEEGEPLFTLYSPDLFEAQREYLEAYTNQRMGRSAGSATGADYLTEARRQRLRMWDLGPEQVKRLETSRLPLEVVPILAPASGHVIEKNVIAGAAVEPGMTLYRIAGLERVWVEAEVYESELALLRAGDPATVTLPHLPGRSFAGRIAFVYPWLDAATRTGRVRVELPNPGLALKPEMYAEVVFERALGERLAVPEEAILYAGDSRYVFLDLGGGRLRPQAVTPGQRAGEWVEILDGLAPGDLVVTSGNFLIAAEARLKLALDHWAPAAAGAEGAAPAPEHPAGEHAAHAATPAPASPAGEHAAHAGSAPAPPARPAGEHAAHAVPAPASVRPADEHAAHAVPAPEPARPAAEHVHAVPAPESTPPEGEHAHAVPAPPAAPLAGEDVHAGHAAESAPPEGEHAHAGHAPAPRE